MTFEISMQIPYFSLHQNYSNQYRRLVNIIIHSVTHVLEHCIGTEPCKVAMSLIDIDGLM
jgi:hypothetical protein